MNHSLATVRHRARRARVTRDHRIKSPIPRSRALHQIITGAGAASRVALGTAVFGGMAFATVFGIFVIPWLYFVVQSLSEKIGGEKTPAEPEPVTAGVES